MRSSASPRNSAVALTTPTCRMPSQVSGLIDAARGRRRSDRRLGEQRRRGKLRQVCGTRPTTELQRVTQVNYLTPAELCRQAIPLMLRQRRRAHRQRLLSRRVAVVSRHRDLRRVEGGAVALHCWAEGGSARPARSAPRWWRLGTVQTELLGTAEELRSVGQIRFSACTACDLSVDVPRENGGRETVDAVRKNRRQRAGAEAAARPSRYWPKFPGAQQNFYSPAFRHQAQVVTAAV